MPDDGTAQLDRLADEYLDRLRRGEDPTPAEYADRYPELAEDILALFPYVGALEDLKNERLAEPEPSARLGEYVLGREIARGGMGIVYDAVQEPLGRRVALKVLPPLRFAAESSVDRFRREAETAARLHHPHIVPIFGFGSADGVHYFAMQRLAGVGVDRLLEALRTGAVADDVPELEAVVAAWTGLSPTDRYRRVARIGAAVADAVDYAHRHGVLHRDVKPGNLIVEASGHVWVTDFGIAKLLDDVAEHDTTGGEFVGTLRYASPEQLDGEFSVRGDVYGIGLTLLELVTLQPVFPRDASKRELVRAVRDGHVPRARSVAPDVPRDLDTVLQKATAFVPDDRYDSASAFADDLQRFAVGRPVLARDVSVAERAWRWTRRNPGVAALGSTTVAAIVGAAIVGWWAFLSTRSALAGQLAATQRTEQNLELTLGAFDDLVDRIAGERTAFRLGDEQVLDVPVLPAIRDKDLDLLERTLRFYDRFCAANADDVALRVDTARAFSRVGEIHRWFGRDDAARATLARSAALYSERLGAGFSPEVAIEAARVDELLGLIEVETGEAFRGRHHFERAQLLLERARSVVAEGELARRVLLRLARLHNTRGASVSRAELSWRRRDRGGSSPTVAVREAWSDHEQALRIASELAATADGRDPAVQLLVARTHRLLAQAGALGAARKADIDRSLDELGELVARWPEVRAFEAELVESLGITGYLTDDFERAMQRTRTAAQRARRLVDLDPDSVERLDALARSLRRLGEVAARGDAHDVAEASFRESVARRDALRRRTPGAVHHVWELARTRSAWARFERARGRARTARELLDAAIVGVSSAVAGPRVAGVRLGSVLRGLYADLTSVCIELGDDAGAERARRAARAAGTGRRRR